MDPYNPEKKMGRAIRVDHHYIIRFREIHPNASHEWDIANVTNISKTGALFNASRIHKAGSELELKLRNPLISKESTLWAKVLRCKTTEVKNMYELAVTINSIEAETREAFDKTIDFFIKQEGKKG